MAASSRHEQQSDPVTVKPLRRSVSCSGCVAVIHLLLLSFTKKQRLLRSRLTSPPRLMNSSRCNARPPAAGLCVLCVPAFGVCDQCLWPGFFTPSFNAAAASILCSAVPVFVSDSCIHMFLFIVGDFLTASMDSPMSKQLSNSSATLHSPETGEGVD